MSLKLTEPRPLKAKLLAWSELNVNEVDMLLVAFRSSSINDIYSFLEKFFDLSSIRPKERIMIDFYYYSIKFAIDNNFTKIQISSFISILRALHKANHECPFDNESYLIQYFKELIICHSIKRPPYCIDVFDNQQIAKVINYITETYLRHVYLYKYAFTPSIGLDLKLNYVNIPENLDEENIDQNNTNRLSYDNENKNDNDIKQENEKRQAKLNDLRSYVKNVLNEHVNSEKMRLYLDELQKEYQSKGEKPLSASSNKPKKNKN